MAKKNLWELDEKEVQRATKKIVTQSSESTTPESESESEPETEIKVQVSKKKKQGFKKSKERTKVIRISDTAHKQAKLAATQNDMTIGQYIESLIKTKK